MRYLERSAVRGCAVERRVGDVCGVGGVVGGRWETVASGAQWTLIQCSSVVQNGVGWIVQIKKFSDPGRCRRLLRHSVAQCLLSNDPEQQRNSTTNGQGLSSRYTRPTPSFSFFLSFFLSFFSCVVYFRCCGFFLLFLWRCKHSWNGLKRLNSLNGEWQFRVTGYADQQLKKKSGLLRSIRFNCLIFLLTCFILKWSYRWISADPLFGDKSLNEQTALQNLFPILNGNWIIPDYSDSKPIQQFTLIMIGALVVVTIKIMT